MFCTPDGGEISIASGEMELDGGLETAVFLSLFGGNEEDSGLQSDDANQWWGNLSERDPARRQRSRTQSLLRDLPLIPYNLARIDDAAKGDLAWLLDSIATTVATRVSMPALNTVLIEIAVIVDGRTHPFAFARSGKQ
jgi:phage gp46-like protein